MSVCRGMVARVLYLMDVMYRFEKKNQPTNNNENFVESCTVLAAAECLN